MYDRSPTSYRNVSTICIENIFCTIIFVIVITFNSYNDGNANCVWSARVPLFIRVEIQNRIINGLSRLYLFFLN